MNPILVAVIIIAFIVTVVGIAYALASSSRESEPAPQTNVGKKNKELISTFQNFSAPVHLRNQAMEALLAIASPEALEVLTEAISHRDDPLWVDLVTKLPNVGAPIHPYLTKAYRSTISRPAIHRMMQAVGPNSARWVAPYLNDPSLKTQHEAVLAMEKSGWIPGKDALSAAYWIAKKEYLNCVSIGEQAVLPLMESLKNVDSVEGPVMALGLIGDLRAGPPLLLIGQEQRNRNLVIRTFSKWGEQCIPILVPELTNPDDGIRQLVLDILDALNWNPAANEAGARFWIAKKRWDKCADIGSPAVKPLQEILEQKASGLKQSAIQTLGLIGSEEALNILLKTVSEPDAPSQLAAVLALGCIKQTEAAQGLVKVLNIDPLAPTAIRALTNLGSIAIPPLTTELKSNDLKMRSRSAETLKALQWDPPKS